MIDAAAAIHAYRYGRDFVELKPQRSSRRRIKIILQMLTPISQAYHNRGRSSGFAITEQQCQARKRARSLQHNLCQPTGEQAAPAAIRSLSASTSDMPIARQANRQTSSKITDDLVSISQCSFAEPDSYSMRPGIRVPRCSSSLFIGCRTASLRDHASTVQRLQPQQSASSGKNILLVGSESPALHATIAVSPIYVNSP